MMRFKTILLLVVFSFMTLCPCAYGSDGEEVTGARKGVKVSTDVLVVAMPVATLTGVLLTRDWTGLKQGALTAMTTLGTVELLKLIVHKRRPDGSNMHSFPSGHTAVSFADAAFVQRRYGWKFGAPAYALAAYIGWGRTFAKKHDWWDVLAGAAIGAGSAYIYTRPLPKGSSLMITPVSTSSDFGFTALYQF